MSLDRRDELAARIAATLDGAGTRATDLVARRAYDLADALLRERARRDRDVAMAFDEDVPEATDPRLDAPPHAPPWEVEPRWSHRDREALEERLARVGPGLASARPPLEPDERTGTE